MSFRGRLLVFFTIIVVIPMIAVALVLFSLTQDSEHGKADARLAGGMRTALAVYDERREDARSALARVAADDQLSAALRGDDRDAIADRLLSEPAQRHRIESARLLYRDGQAPGVRRLAPRRSPRPRPRPPRGRGSGLAPSRCP